MRNFVARLFLAASLILALGGALFANITGDLQGTVLDPAGAAVPDAKVTVTDTGTGAARVLMTDEQGQWSAPQLAIGSYKVTIEKTGFETLNQTAVVRSGEKTRLDVKLTVGTVGQTVTVETSALPTLDVASSQVSDSLNSEEVLALPNLARNPVAFAALSPGTVPVTKDNPFLGVGSFNSNGSRGRANNITVDGVTAADISTTGTAGAAYTANNVQEFKVITNNFDAEFGRNSGAQVQIITKSGTNEYHGSAYYFAQNTYFGNARDTFDTTGHATPTIQNQGGVTFGAPIYKDHTFFYGGWEVDRTRGKGSSTVATVLTPAQAAGITDPTAQAIFKSDGSPQAANGLLPQSAPNLLNADVWSIRVDQILRGGKDSLFVRYGQNPVLSIRPSITFVSTNLAGFGASQTSEARDLTIGYTATFSSAVVNSFHFAFGRSNPFFAINSPFPQGPQINIAGLSNFGESDIIPQGRVQNTFEYSDTVSWAKGRHTIKFGEDVFRYQAPSVFDALEKGVFGFGGVADFQAGNPASFQQFIGGTTRHNFALDAFSFVQDDYRLTDTLTLNLGFRLESSGGVTELKNLLSNLDPNNKTPIGAVGTGPLGGVDLGGDAFHRNWNPAPRLGFAWNPGRGKLVVRGGYGIAYDFIYQNPITNLRFSPPFVSVLTITSFTGGNSFANLVAGTAPAQAAAAASLGTFDPNRINFGNFSPVAQNLQNPRNQQWDAGVEYQATSNLVLKTTYVGTRNDHLQVSQPINSVPAANIPPAPTSLADQTARLGQFTNAFNAETGSAFGPALNTRLDPRFNAVTQVQSTGTSSYNSLQLEAVQRLSHGLTFDANYTWSHSIDDVSDALGVLINDSANLLDPSKPLSFQRSNSQFDIRNRFVLSYDYQIPFANGFHGIAKSLLGGWETSGIFSSQSGLPATVYAAPIAGTGRTTITDPLLDGNLNTNGTTNVALNGDATQLHPVPLGDPQVAPIMVSEPLLEQDGTSGRNHLRLDGLTDFDMTLSKSFRVTESKSFLLRWEMYNVLNHPNFAGYINNFSSRFFNTYTTTSTNSRQFQLGAKFIF